MKRAKGKKKGASTAPALERILGYAGSDVEPPLEESEEEEEEEDEENKVRSTCCWAGHKHVAPPPGTRAVS